MELENRESLEAKFAARMGRLSGRLRRQLIELLGNPPDVTRVPDSFWTEAEEEMKRELAIVLLLVWGVSARQHGLDAGLAEVGAARYAAVRSQLVASQFTSNSRNRLPGLPRPGQTAEEIAADVFSPSRAELIATTETTAAASGGSEAAAAQTVGLTELDTWFTVNDSAVCPICSPLHAAKRSEWMAVFPLGPPGHPNCRCWIEYAAEKTRAFA